MAKKPASGRVALTDSPFLKKARERFKLASDADVDQAKREQEDLAFYAGDQWPADLKLARQGQQPVNGMPAVPARPTLVINKVREPVRQIQNEIRDADIGVELTPADDFGDLGITPDDTEVTLREGLIRRIIRDSKGQDAWNWGGDRADIAGRGYFAVMTRYLPGKTNDQEIYLDRIFNQASVVGDPSRTEPDGSDAGYWFWGAWMQADRFVAEWPTIDGAANPFANAQDQDFMSAAESYPNWYRAEGSGEAKTWSVRVCNYLYTEYASRELVTLSDGVTVMWADELPDGAAEMKDSRRSVLEKQIKFCKIAGGILELERTDWPSQDMPIIETLGEELHPYDEQRRVEGAVRNAIGAQMGSNYLISKFVETVGLSPIPRDRIDPDAIDGYEQWWAVANTRTLPYLPYRTRDDQGNEFRAPTPGNGDPNVLPMAQGISLFDQFIKSTTAVPDPTLGNVDPSLKSGRAIRETVANAKGSTSNFLTNRVRSIRRAAEVINGLLYPIYGQRPGRMVRVMTGEGTHEAMVIGDQQQGQDAAIQQRAAKVAKLTEDAKFNIAVKVTKNFETRRQQENSALADLISAEPNLMTWFGDMYLGSSDMPGRKLLAERAEVMLAPPIQQMLQAKKQGGTFDPAAQAKIAQLTDQVQHAEAAMQQLAQEADGKRLDAQTKVQIEQGRLALEKYKADQQFQQAIVLQQMKDATAIRTAEVKAGTEGDKLLHESDALNRSQAHEAALEQTSQAHDLEMSDRAMAHAAAIGDGQAEREDANAATQRQFDAGEAERGRQATAAENEANRQATANQGAEGTK